MTGDRQGAASALVRTTDSELLLVVRITGAHGPGVSFEMASLRSDEVATVLNLKICTANHNGSIRFIETSGQALKLLGSQLGLIHSSKNKHAYLT